MLSDSTALKSSTCSGFDLPGIFDRLLAGNMDRKVTPRKERTDFGGDLVNAIAVIAGIETIPVGIGAQLTAERIVARLIEDELALDTE